MVKLHYVDEVSRERKEKGLGLILLLFVAPCSGSVCRWTHGVNQNPITAEVIDARLQVSQVSKGIPARIKKSQHARLLSSIYRGEV